MASSKVLIVEDNRIVAEDLQTSLEKLGFYVAGIVCDGPETLSSVKEKLPDLVLMDIVLRGEMDGIATAEQIKSQFNVPVVYLTAHSEEVVFERAKSTDPFGYLLKPFSERELDIAVQMALYKHKLEKQLKASKDTLHNIVNLNTDGIVVLDKDKIIRFLKPAACHLLGGKADDFFNNVFRYSFEPGATTEVVIKNIDGRMIDVEISATATRWQEDEAILLTLRDITQKKQL
ncbi:MAG: response regulator [Desulfobacterales bacterium]